MGRNAANSNELKLMSDDMIRALNKDRFELFKNDILRTLIFVAITLAILYIYLLNKIKPHWVLLLISLLSLTDLWTVNKRYLNDDSFVGDVLQDKAPITNAEGDYYAIVKEMDSQYGDITSLN